MRTLFAKKLDIAIGAIDKYMGDSVVTMDTHSGISLNLRLKKPGNEEELIEKARSIGLQIVPVSDITDQETSALSFYYSQLPIYMIEDKVKELKEIRL